MNKIEIVEYYSKRKTELSTEIGLLKRKNRLFVVSELLSFIGAIAAVAAYTVYGGMIWLLTAALQLVAYIVIRQADGRNGSRIETLTDLKRVYEKELSYYAGDYSCFADGSEYADPKHPFTYDMDIFERQSLFQRINRTVSSGGADRLAECLSNLSGDKDFIDCRREVIDRLAEMEAERAAFMAQGQRQKIETRQIQEALEGVAEMSLSRFPLSPLSLVLAVMAIVALLTVVVLAFFGVVSGTMAMMWATMQLFVVMMLCLKSIKMISKSVNNLHKQMKQYVELIRLTREMVDKLTSQQVDKLFATNTHDSSNKLHAFCELRSILDALDRRGNVLGLMFTNMFLLSDYFLVRRFIKWKERYLDKVGEWIDEVSTMDALVSMATFAYNEPRSGRAEIVESDEVVYEAKGLYHPFVGDKAVRNDFNIVDNNYYIITGANMAGKSTFLRSIGINYILAQNGMPVFADSLRVSSYNLFTSMRTSDDLSSGISYFNAELLRLKQLIDSIKASHPTFGGTGESPTLIILDEILKGTNSLDKLNGSRMFLEAMSAQPVSGIIATHDLELSKMADERPDRFHNYCFEIELSDNIIYTYKITPGVAHNQNATFLLKNIIRSLEWRDTM
ncbi:MAG: DNA mismatch repair protein MutS [Prevotella sp.]|nr:DNA mismatch repair protein MutS [Prevotella sp.]